jgi:Uma2 family endonuclease
MSAGLAMGAAGSQAPGTEPSWPIPPPEGFTAEDLDRLPDLPPHTELIDGSLILVSPQTILHAWMVSLLERTLERQAPEHLRVCREMTVTLGARQRPEPDVLVVQAEAVAELTRTTFRPDEVELAIEVVSQESVERDRHRKPQLYAQAGIRHFWRAEFDQGEPVVYTYELDSATHGYGQSGIHRDRLKLPAPFPLDIDLTEIHRR